MKTFISISMAMLFSLIWNSQAQSSNASSNDNVTLVSHVPSDVGDDYAVFAEGNYVYTGDGNNLKIVDISDPSNPSVAATYTLPVYVEGIFVKDGYAYVADGNAGLQILNVQDPTSPSFVTSKDTWSAFDVFVSGDYAYIADSDSGLRIIDISGLPGKIDLIGTCDTDGMSYGVRVSGNYAYIADFDGGLAVIDISNPYKPTVSTTYSTTGYAEYVCVRDDYVYLADGASGLLIYQMVEGPADLQLVGSFDPDSDPNSGPFYRGLFVSTGHFAYVAESNSDGNLTIIDATDATKPTQAGFYADLPRGPVATYVNNGLVFVADVGYGMYILQPTVNDNSLPVTFNTFSIIGNASQAILRWTTQSELENLGFEVYRSLNKETGYQLLSSYKTNPALQGAGSSSEAHHYEFIDHSVVRNVNYWYKIADVDLSGKRTFHPPVSFTANDNALNQISKNIPKQFSLNDNYPNPFNPVTTITFSVPKIITGQSPITLAIFNQTGQKIKTLVQATLQPGVYTVRWNGTNAAGNQVANGLYYYGIRSQTFTQFKKMVLLR